MNDIIKYDTILENHYYSTNGSAVKYETRNICADSTAKILKELGKILFPDEEIEIYVIPAKDGCHQDTFWLKHKDEIKVGIIIAVIGGIFYLPGQISQIITDSSTRKLNESQKKLNESQVNVNQTQEELNKLQIKQLKKEVKKIDSSINLPNEQYKNIIENKEIKKRKNQHFEQLINDKDIIKEKIIAKQNNKIFFEKTITRNDFLGHIEEIEQFYTIKTIEKIHHLTVIKPVNDEEYKDLMWIVEDINGKNKFGVHMCDEEFYEIHLKKVLGLTELIVRVKYTIEEDQDGIISIKNKEVILVYQYNGINREKIPEGEEISSAPLEIGKTIKEDFKVMDIENKREKIKDSNQLPLFQV